MLYTLMLKFSKKELDLALKGRDGYILTYRLICFIYLVFLIIEKFNIIKESDNILCGLKRFYNIIKHNYCPEDIFDSLCLSPAEKREIPVFMEISNIKDMGKPDKIMQEQTEKYNKYIKNKSIISITDYAFGETITLLKEYDYI